MDEMRTLRSGLSVGVMVSLLAASGGDPPATNGNSTGAATCTPGGASAIGACDLTEPDVVASIFGGTAKGEEPGIARNCSYKLDGGTADQIEVYYYGKSSEWEGIREGYADNRGPLTDVSGVGDEAFNPGDAKDYELVVWAGDVVFAVGLGSLKAPDDYAERHRTLAKKIAADVG